MAELDDIIHQPLRLKIMAALNALPAAAGLEFSRLKKLTGATDGNLGAHQSFVTKGDAEIFHAKACSRPPEPSRRMCMRNSNTGVRHRVGRTNLPLAARGS